jgi:hypothetical protein
VADKKRVKRNIKQLQRIKTWQLVVVLILVGLLAATFLRLNNIGMVERRTAVFSADKSDSNQDLKNNLYALQRYSAAHMNADTGVIYLEDSYKKDVKELTEKAQRSSNNITSKIVKDADRVCKSQYGGYSQAYVQCFVNEQAKHKGSNDLVSNITLPNPELYRHEFYSPRWSPDFAGWSLVLCSLITLVIISRAIGLVILKALLRKHYSSI